MLNIYLKVSCNLPALTEKYEIKLSILPLEKGILKIMGVVVKCYKWSYTHLINEKGFLL